MIPVSKPNLSKKTLDFAKKALDSKWVSSKGDYTYLAGDLLSQLTGCFVVLTNNGTSAMHLVSKVLDQFEGDGVAVPDNSYVAAWNTLLFDKTNFIYPIPSNLETWNMDLDFLINKNPKKALIVHNLGNIIDVDKLSEKLPKTFFVEDSCEAFNAHYSLARTSLCGAISFYGNKIITTGEGGAFLCHDASIADYAEKIIGQGQTSTRFVHDTLGTNYRMTNIQAALLVGQLLELDELSLDREELFNDYNKAFQSVKEIIPQKIEFKHSHWMYGIRILGSTYSEAETFFREKEIEIRPMFYPMSSHKHLQIYARKEQECNASLINKEGIILPTYSGMKKQELRIIINAVKDYISWLSKK